MSLPEEIDLWEVTKQYPIIICDWENGPQLVLMVRLSRKCNLFSVGSDRAEDTLYLCRHYPVSLVISDSVIFGMSGFELIQTLRGDTRTQHIPIIICSARSGDKDRALELGANDFFRKPTGLSLLDKMLPRIRQLVAAAYSGLTERQFDHPWQPDTEYNESNPPTGAPYRVQIPDHKWLGRVWCR